MAGFASSVLLGDLNDFISPSQACVNPIFATGREDAAASTGQSSGIEADPETRAKLGLPKVGLQLEADLGEAMAVEEAFTAPPDLIKATGDQQTAKVSLSDCLACSGCVTSAETVLIEQQSAGEFEKAAASGDYDQVVVTISAQSLASLATHFGQSKVAMRERLRKLLVGRKRVTHVLGASVAGDIALVEMAAEFMHRFRAAEKPGWQSPESTVALNSHEAQLRPNGPDSELLAHGAEVRPGRAVPLLSSACPGWICFVEKSHPEAIPYISSAKSPQQAAGALVKRMVAARTGTPAARVYHATVMPCADKKLEASRKDFLDKETDTQDVDCVLTTTELAEMLNAADTAADGADGDGADDDVAMAGADGGQSEAEQGWDSWMSALGGSPGSAEGQALMGASAGGGGSGGYLEHVFRRAAKELFGVDVPDGPLPYKQGRNADIRTVELHVGGKPVLRFAAAYGFRNIQSIVRQLKRGKCPYDFVEIMACPGGCLNGGGQARPARQETNADDVTSTVTTAAAGRKRLAAVDAVFHDRQVRAPEDNPALQRVYADWVQGAPFSAAARALLHTRYHAVPKLENGLTERW